MTQIISALGLWLYPTIALVLFLAAFVAIMVRVLHPSRRAELLRAAALPLEEDAADQQAHVVQKDSRQSPPDRRAVSARA